MADDDEDEVVLCKHCGTSLHDIEHDVFREDTKNHRCREMAEARVRELEAGLIRIAKESSGWPVEVARKTLGYTP